MKTHHVTLLLVTLLLVLGCRTSVSPFAAPESPPAPTARDNTAAGFDRDLYAQGLIPQAQVALDALPGATKYRIDAVVTADFTRLEGHQVIRYTNREPAALDALYFQLFPNISGGQTVVPAVRVDGTTVTPVREYGDSAIRLPLPGTLPPSEDTVIEMDFIVTIAQSMAGNYGLFGYFDDVLVLDTFYPVIPVYDDEGWNVKAPPSVGDLTYFDASFYDVRFTAPEGLTVIASGIEVERSQDDGWQTVRFAAGPARDFYIAAGEKFTVVSQKVGPTTVNSYARRNRKAGAEKALAFAVEALKSFSARFGDYPYTEFDVVSTPMQALGIEYPGLVGITLKVYDVDATVAGLPAPVLMESVVAHEAGHQWFYNLVGNDQVDEPWLDEALTQYVTGLYYLDVHGESAAQSYRRSWDDRWQRVDRETLPVGLPSGDYDPEDYGPIVYGRGPLFVAALAEAMGQPAFDDFLRDYVTTFTWGIATGTTFRQLAEAHCACDLGPLFEAWVYDEERAP